MTQALMFDDLAARLDDAERTATAMPQLTGDRPLSIDEAYLVQRALIQHRLARGESDVGVKLGFTSHAKRVQMGVPDVVAGRLTSGMRILDGGSVALSELVHPRVEPEVAFRLGCDVDPADPAVDVEAAVDAVATAIEVIDSRYADFRFSLADVIADNTSASRFVVGPWRRYDCDLSNRGVVLEVDGGIVETGSTAAVLGHPVRALHALVRLAARHEFALPAGTIVLAGAATAAVPLDRTATVVVSIAGLGRAVLRVGGEPDA